MSSILVIILNFIKKHWKEILIVLLFLGLFFTYKYLVKEKEEKERYKQSTFVLAGSLDSIKDKNGIMQKEQEQLQLTVKDIKKLSEEGNKTIQKLLKELENSNIKLKKADQLENVTINSLYHFRPDLVDSLYRVDTIVKIYDSTKQLTEQYSDKWITYKRYINSSGQPDIFVQTKNDLCVSRSWYREGFFLWRWLKKKQYKYTVKDLNPYSNITNFIVIDIKK